MLVWIKVIVFEPVQSIPQSLADRLKRQLVEELQYYQHGQQPSWMAALELGLAAVNRSRIIQADE